TRARQRQAVGEQRGSDDAGVAGLDRLFRTLRPGRTATRRAEDAGGDLPGRLVLAELSGIKREGARASSLFYSNPGGRLLPADALALVRDVVDDDVVADLIGRGIENAPRVEAGELVDEAAAVEIRAEHEGIDLDAALRAAPDFLEGLLHDSLVQQRRAPAAVQPAAAVERHGRGLAVGDENDLAVARFLRAEDLPRKAQRLLDVRAVLHEVGDGDDRGQILRADDLRVRAERHQVEHVLRIFRLDQPVQRERHLFPRVQRVVHEHRIAHVDQQHRLAVGGKFLAMDGEVVGADFQRHAATAALERVHERLADVDVHRVAVLVFLRLLERLPVQALDHRVVVAPAVAVEHLEDLAERLVADPAHSLGAQAQPLAGADEVTVLFEHVLDALQVLELLVGLVAQELADLVEIEIGDIGHAALPPSDELREPPELSQHLAGFAHAHALRALERILVQQLLELLHLAERFAQLAELFLGHRVQILQQIVDVLDGRVENVGKIFEKIFILEQLVHPLEHLHQVLMPLAGHVLRSLHLALRDLVLQAVAQLLVALETFLHLLRELVHVL